MYDEIATLESPRVASVSRKKIRTEGGRESGSGETEAQRISTKVYCTSFDSRIGRIYVASTEKGACKISVPKEARKDFIDWLKEHFDVDDITDNRARNKEIIDQLTRYFNGKLAKFTCPIDLLGTPFQTRVWNELLRVPYGSTITYKHLARRVAAPKATQAVGRANSANPLPIIVPCHRVLASNGALVGYSCGIKTKEFLLRLEGSIML
ncbi:MAG: methylated-DNA--[protein]-cysteine S-methyltransferase [Ignavibacteriae bacterium]|nr:methylated-DNA--[protein]-cysteine S-methyltransferase [Ignavibacteria bacterium]MBI3365696.1 methylated-DNA--[protein]-cysteine S-methyltransferase [Ignavibacteriota bacterium]